MPIDAIGGGSFAYGPGAKPVSGDDRLQDRIREQRDEEKPSLSATEAVEKTESDEPREVRASAKEDETRSQDPREERGQAVNILV